MSKSKTPKTKSLASRISAGQSVSTTNGQSNSTGSRSGVLQSRLKPNPRRKASSSTGTKNSIDKFDTLIKRDKAAARANISKSKVTKDSGAPTKTGTTKPRKLLLRSGQSSKASFPPLGPRSMQGISGPSGLKSQALVKSRGQLVGSISTSNNNNKITSSNRSVSEEPRKLRIRGVGTPTTVRITHLDPETTPGDLIEILRRLGLEVVSISISCVNKTKTRYGCATIVFKNRDEALTCVDNLDGAEADDSGVPLVAEITSASGNLNSNESQQNKRANSSKQNPRKTRPVDKSSSLSSMPEDRAWGRAAAVGDSSGSVRYVKGRGFN